MSDWVQILGSEGKKAKPRPPFPAWVHFRLAVDAFPGLLFSICWNLAWWENGSSKCLTALRTAENEVVASRRESRKWQQHRLRAVWTRRHLSFAFSRCSLCTGEHSPEETGVDSAETWPAKTPLLIFYPSSELSQTPKVCTTLLVCAVSFLFSPTESHHVGAPPAAEESPPNCRSCRPPPRCCCFFKRRKRKALQRHK